jgi:DNA-binding transcriptional MerR regulator
MADVDRVSEICGLIGEGLTLAGIRRVLELQAEVAALQAQVASLKAAAKRG